MSKQLVLLRDVITQYHPQFVGNKQLCKLALNNPDMFNTELLVEQAMAHIGKYKHTPGDHMDFSDGSDCKTASIRVNPVTSTNQGSHVGEIAAIVSPGGTLKAGALRCVIYNPHTDSLLYYFLPKSAWSKLITLHPTTGIGKLVFRYHKPTDYIRRLDGYRVMSFRQLARSK